MSTATLDKRVHDFIATRRQLFIDGQLVDASRASGWGREMGHEAFEAYTEVKAVCTQL